MILNAYGVALMFSIEKESRFLRRHYLNKTILLAW